MVLLYFVAGCVLLCLGSAEDVVYHDGHADEGHSRDEYPNPKSLIDYVRCRRKLVESYICDPDSVVSELEGYPFFRNLVVNVFCKYYSNFVYSECTVLPCNVTLITARLSVCLLLTPIGFSTVCC